jgi:hypothetical protein
LWRQWRGRTPHHHDKSGDKNFGFVRGFCEHFEGDHDDRGGGRRAGHEDQRAGGGRGNGCCSILMMKMNLRATMRRSMMMMRILLPMVDGLNVTEVIIVVLAMMVNIIVVAMGLIRTVLLVSSYMFQNFQ